MTLRLVATPLEHPLEAPPPRAGGLDAGLAEAFVASAARDEQLARLQRPDALAVTSGQQPGLFTGPLYTIYKAVSAAALARVLEEQWGRPVVPVFWLAGDDHDFAEASRAAWIAADGSLTGAELPSRPADAPLTPMYRQPLGPPVTDALAALAGSLPTSEFRDATLAWLERHYRPEATVAGAFAGALAELLAPLGVLAFDSTHAAAKRSAAPYLVRALQRSRELDQALAARSEALGDAARAAGISLGDGATLVMLEASQGRDRLVRENGGFVTRRSRETFDLATLQQIAADQPQRLSPNVLLRPVVESALLPTVAYLGGPGELRYLELTPPLYRQLDVPRQLPLPRWSGMIVEPRVERVLDKFAISLEELLEPPGPLESRLVRSELPAEAVTALERVRAALQREYEVVERTAVEVDPTLARPVQSVRQQALAGAQEIEKKLVQHLKRRRETELSQLARARTALAPDGKPQERVLTIAPFLARYGPALLEELAGAFEGWYRAALEGAPEPA